MFAVAKAARDEQDILDAIQEGNKDNEDGDPLTFVTDLLRALSKRTKRLPARDRYFLSQEAEASDPLCYEDPADATTDIEDHGDEGWDEDSDKEFDPDEEVEDYKIVQQDHHMS
jgi:hypothetical protein